MDCPASMHGITSSGNSVAAAGGCRTFLKQSEADSAGGTKEKADGAGKKDPKMQLPGNGSKDCIGWQERDC